MSERVINDPAAGGWELNPDTGYWMWAAGGGSIQDGDTEGQITTWDGTEWTPESNVVVDANGNVGIGTISPSSYNSVGDDLVIASDGYTGMTIASASDKAGTIYFADGTSGPETYRGFLEYDHADDKLKIGIKGTERIRIDGDGNVNITGKLFVNGEEVTAGGGDSFWVEESPGVIKYTGTAKAADMVSTG